MSDPLKDALYLALPGHARARIAPSKLSAYLLEPEHPQGGPKARAFRDVLGYGREHVEMLGQELLAVGRRGVVSAARYARHPQRAVQYEVIGSLTGPNGHTATVLTAWQVDAPGEAPYLITARLVSGRWPTGR